MCSAVLIGWDPAPPPPRIWAHIRGRYYWSAKIDDISLWPHGFYLRASVNFTLVHTVSELGVSHIRDSFLYGLSTVLLKDSLYGGRGMTIHVLCSLRGYAQSFFFAQKSNQNTWFSATLVFSLVFRWFSAVSPTLCTVISKKTKLSCFGGFFSLVF